MKFSRILPALLALLVISGAFLPAAAQQMPFSQPAARPPQPNQYQQPNQYPQPNQQQSQYPQPNQYQQPNQYPQPNQYGQPNQPVYAAQVFPPLPPSRPCTANYMVGVWKLVHVYESPSSNEAMFFMANPLQYVLFNADSTYGKYNAGRTDVAPNLIRGEITKHISGLQQYLVDTTGFVFFYQNKTAIDTQACFIVANQLGVFSVGEMLLMPPQGQIQGRLLNVYQRVNENPPRPRGRR